MAEDAQLDQATSGPVSQLPQTRTARHRRIVDLLTRQPIRSQSQLAKLLADDGLAVTQATLSRDPDELGAVEGCPAAGVGAVLSGSVRQRPASRGRRTAGTTTLPARRSVSQRMCRWLIGCSPLRSIRNWSVLVQFRRRVCPILGYLSSAGFYM